MLSRVFERRNAAAATTDHALCGFCLLAKRTDARRVVQTRNGLLARPTSRRDRPRTSHGPTPPCPTHVSRRAVGCADRRGFESGIAASEPRARRNIVYAHARRV